MKVKKDLKKLNHILLNHYGCSSLKKAPIPLIILILQKMPLDEQEASRKEYNKLGYAHIYHL